MTMFNCCKCNCTFTAFVAAVVVGVVAAFLQVTSVIAAGPVFFWVLFGIAVVYLATLAGVGALRRQVEACECKCQILRSVLAGILGTILFSAVLLLVDVAAASVIGAILIGALFFFFALTVAGTALLVRCLFGCGD